MHQVSVVVPVYQGSETLSSLVDEIKSLVSPSTTPSGVRFLVSELILVDDCGPDDSRSTISILADTYSFVKPVWLSRNFGQHAATLAGISATSGKWIATIDEDGQHDPRDIGLMLDKALSERAHVCYAKSSNEPPHGPLRNLMSRCAKVLSSAITGSADPLNYSSFRLILGDIGRSVAAYAGEAVYLDVALSWIADRSSAVRVDFRQERREKSGYTFATLLDISGSWY